MKTYGDHHNATFAKIQSAQTPKITGPGSSSIKYDILTALLATTSHEQGAQGRLAQRLALVITARFDWKRGTFNVGLRELARMWGVTERTAKREMAAMRGLGWISVERQAARGRVARHRIELAVVLQHTSAHWDAIGPDFAARLRGNPEPQATSNVVPLRAETVSIPAPDGSDWPEVAQKLTEQNPGLFASWYSQLSFVDEVDGVWNFLAPSRFVAGYIEAHLQPQLLIAIASVDRSVRSVRIKPMES